MAFDIWQLATHDLAEVATTPAATPATAPCHRFDLPMPEDFAGYTINLHMRSDIEQRDYLWPFSIALGVKKTRQDMIDIIPNINRRLAVIRTAYMAVSGNVSELGDYLVFQAGTRLDRGGSEDSAEVYDGSPASGHDLALTSKQWLSIAASIQEPYQALVTALHSDQKIVDPEMRIQVKAAIDTLITLRALCRGPVNFGQYVEFCKRVKELRSYNLQVAIGHIERLIQSCPAKVVQRLIR